jgi:cytochrome P450
VSLTRISGADLRTKEYRRSPFALWRRMRDEQPLLYDEVADCWVLSRYDDVVAVLNDPGTYSAQTYQERFRPVFGRTFAELDGRKQIRERTIVAPTFVGGSLTERGGACWRRRR